LATKLVPMTAWPVFYDNRLLQPLVQLLGGYTGGGIDRTS
jgi:hypothetical protein